MRGMSTTFVGDALHASTTGMSLKPSTVTRTGSPEEFFTVISAGVVLSRLTVAVKTVARSG